MGALPQVPELDVGQEGEDDQPETIGMEEMLYASKSTLENAEDGNISTEEYHLKFVTKSGFQYQFGCLTDTTVTSGDIANVVKKLRETFQAVDMESINEDDYFFELMSPFFYYTSGSYKHTQEQVQTTFLALSNTALPESENNSPLENNVFTLLVSDASYQPEVLPFLDFGQSPTNQKKRIRENDIKFQCKAHRQTTEVKMKSFRVVWFMQKEAAGGNWSYFWMIQLSIVLLAQSLQVRALPVNAETDSPLTLTVGLDGVIPFACRNEQQSGTKYYTVKFEEKDRPFYIDGDFDLEGLMSPDQAERFRVAYSEEGSSMSVEINIASVSIEDQGTYIVLLIIQGVTPEPEYHLMKKVVLIFIPPSPANCFLELSEDAARQFKVLCFSEPGNGNSTLTCFQNGDKIPYQKDGVDTQIVSTRLFWVMHTNVHVSCCSHDIKEIDTITQTSCDQYRYPRIELANSPISPGNKIPTKMVLTTKPLSVEEEKKQPSLDITPYSGCDRNVDRPAFMLHLMAFFTIMCMSNP